MLALPFNVDYPVPVDSPGMFLSRLTSAERSSGMSLLRSVTAVCVSWQRTSNFKTVLDNLPMIHGTAGRLLVGTPTHD